MEIVQALMLGVIQGLTEFLPISSSGHLVLARSMFGYKSVGLTFEIFVHFGTVLSVIVAFRNDLKSMLTGYIQGILKPGQWKDLWSTSSDFRMGWFVLIGIIPAGFAGLAGESYVEKFFQDPLLVGCMLLVTGLILWSSRLIHTENNHPLTVIRVILIGCAQVLAIIPGISRSGTTITAGLWLRLPPEMAAKFSFYLVIPVILGASGLEFVHITQQHLTATQLWGVIVGTISAFLSGWLAIIFLMDTLRKGKFSLFALYCALIGAVTIFISL